MHRYTWVRSRYTKLRKYVDGSSGADWWSMSDEDKRERWGADRLETCTLLKNDVDLYDLMHESLGQRPAQDPGCLLQSGMDCALITSA